MHSIPWVALLAACGVQAFPGSRPRGPYFEEDDAHTLRLVQRDDAKPIIQGSFDQLVDHNNISMGTFKQRYWYSLEFWAGPGSPVSFFNPGDEPADDFVFWVNSDYAKPGLVAKAIGGAIVLLENRYYGESLPYQTLTTENLQLLNFEQSLKDQVYFANNVDLPFGPNGSANADRVPWVNLGCSMSGAFVSMTERFIPGTFWASWSSSGAVQGIENYWKYFDAALAAFPKNCTTDVLKVVAHLDDVFDNGTAGQIENIKKTFGAPGLKDDADFMNLLGFGPQTYQTASLNIWDSWNFCDYVEGVQGQANTTGLVLPGPEGVGLEKALDGYARWTREYFIPGHCSGQGPWKGENNTDCLALSDPDNLLYANRSANNPLVNLQFFWFSCNEPMGDFQTGAPAGKPAMVSKRVSVEYMKKQCANYFPTGPHGESFGYSEGKTVNRYNTRWGGYSDLPATVKRMIISNGLYDPWRPTSFASLDRPGGPLGNSTYVKTFLNPKGNHCTDDFRNAGSIWPEVKALQDAAIAQIKEWVSEWPKAG